MQNVDKKSMQFNQKLFKHINRGYGEGVAASKIWINPVLGKCALHTVILLIQIVYWFSTWNNTAVSDLSICN